jgi:hypothetical protein
LTETKNYFTFFYSEKQRDVICGDKNKTVSTGNGKSRDVYKKTIKNPEACYILKGG